MISEHSERRVDSILETHIYTVLVELGIADLNGHFEETPRRVAAFLSEFVNPHVDLAEILRDGFEHDSSTAMVVQTGIPFRMLCAHHLAPATGFASIGYIPNERIVGLSKLARLVDAAGTRIPSTQEKITDEIADVIDKTLYAKGVMVVTQAEHTCMTARGVKAPGTRTNVSAIRGVFKNATGPRMEFMGLAKL